MQSTFTNETFRLSPSWLLRKKAVTQHGQMTVDKLRVLIKKFLQSLQTHDI